MSRKRIAFLFPGQGAQYIGMAKEFYQNYSATRELFEEAEEHLGLSLCKVIFEGPESELTETKMAQVALFVSSIGIMRAVQREFPEFKPLYTSGLSLGEYTAAVAAGLISFKAGLPLVAERGRLMNEACIRHPGAMAAVLGLEGDLVEEIVRAVNLPNDLWVANLNCPQQVVISGTELGIAKGSEALKGRGAKRVIPLNVHGAFHSGLMRSATWGLEGHLADLPIMESSVGFVMNVPGDFVSSVPLIRRYLGEQVVSPVRWERGVRAMDAKGVDLFVELGGKTLLGFNKRMGLNASTCSIERPSDLVGLSEALNG